MFLTKECDYAVRVVRCLSSGERKPVKSVCEKEHIPLPFAYKILKKLENAKIVQSYRGSTGGYQLNKDPSTITLLQIVTAVDDSLLLNECLQGDYACENDLEGSPCMVHRELIRVQDILLLALKEKTMEEMAV